MTAFEEVNDIEVKLAEYDVEVWRKRFEALNKRYLAGDYGIFYKSLAKVDQFYDTAAGVKELDAVRYSRGKIKAVVRAVMALEKFFNELPA